MGLKYIQKTSKKITSNFLEELLIDRGILRDEWEFKSQFLKPTKENLEDFRHLDNIEEGADLLEKHIFNGNKIYLVVD